MDETSFDQPAAQAFLADPHVGVLAVAAPDGPPAAVPLWYAYAPGGDVTIVTPASSRKARLLEHTRTATLVVDTVEPRVRYVSVDLELVGRRPATDDDRRALAARYLAGEALEGYLAMATEQFLDEQVTTLRPTHWRFADLTG